MPAQPDLSTNAPWKRRFRAPYMAWSTVARHNPARGLAGTTNSGQYQLYAWDTASNRLRPLTFKPASVPFGIISPDGRWVYYMNDTRGNEIGHFVRVAFEGGAPQDITPHMPPYSAFGIGQSPDGRMLGTTISDDTGFHTIVLPVQDGEIGMPRQIYHSPRLTFGPTFSADASIGVVTTGERGRNQYYGQIALEIASGKRIAEIREDNGATLWPHSFSPIPGDHRIMAVTNISGFSRPILWNPLTGERTELPLPDFPGDISPLDWSADGERLLIAQSYQARQKLAIYELASGRLTMLKAPPGYYGMGSDFGAEHEILANWQDSTHPPRVIALDAGSGKRLRTVLPAGRVPRGHPWKHVLFKASDGETLQGWLALPEGKGPFPTILHVHGGPETHTVEYFLPQSQAWVDHGYAWMALNYRGSTGFGRDFREKIRGDLGHWEVDDMVSARQWLTERGIADPGKVFVTGWSYGGTLTCLALGRYPGYWAGGMAGAATVDWAMEYEDLSPSMRGYSVAVMGGTPQEKPEQYALASPMHYVNNIIAPLLIIQGRSDTRTPARPVEVFEQKLEDLGRQIEVHWYDAGHLGGGVEQDIEEMELMLQFAQGVVTKGSTPPPELMANFFDRRAVTYEDKMWRGVDPKDNIWAAVAAQITGTDRKLAVLDLGCGTGLELGEILAKAPNARVTGVDVSGEMLRILKTNFMANSDRLDLVQDSFLMYPLGSSRYDYILSSWAMHHLLPAAKLVLYRRIRNALKPGGVYIEGDYFATARKERESLEEHKKRAGQLESAEEGAYHIDVPLSLRTQKRLLFEAGFKKMQVTWRRRDAAVYVASPDDR